MAVKVATGGKTESSGGDSSYADIHKICKIEGNIKVLRDDFDDLKFNLKTKETVFFLIYFFIK